MTTSSFSPRPELLPRNERLPWTDADVVGSIPARFERIAAAFPDHEAVRSGTRSLTYDQLNRAANRLARAIVGQLGEGGGEPVAIVLGHDLPVIVSILAVLKSGNIYVPLDPAQPLARAAAIVDDAGARLLISGGAALSRARELAGTAGIVLDIDTLDATLRDENLGLAIGPDTLLNIMYTSGSTGTPKGVLQTHGNLLHEMGANVHQFGLGPSDRITLLLATGFGGSAADIASALLNGGALLLFDVKREGLAALGPWLRRERATLYHSVPTVFRHLLSTLGPDEVLPDLRFILLGGESVLARDVALFRRHFSDECVLRVGLGSTEAYLATRFLVRKNTDVGEGVVPIGMPNDGKQVLLLDDAGNPVADGELGEIVVVSRWLSPGYWRRPEQSQATFERVPGSDERRYHTGDLGRRLPDGNLQHLGRKDFQVKIRGNRVEVGEIETRLMELDVVREAAVMARPDHAGEQRLVAYIVPETGASPSAAELRNALGHTLPDWMLPSAWVTMERLPLLPFGKVDRMALPAPQWTERSSSAAYEPPRTPLEELLAGIWSELLGVENAGIHDEFLDLGGNSLLAAQVVTRVTGATGVELAPTALFDAPTIETLALLIARHAATDYGGDIVALLDELELSDEQARAQLDGGSPMTDLADRIARLSPEKRALLEQRLLERSTAGGARGIRRRSPGEPALLSFGQQRLWFLDQLEPDSPLYIVPSAQRIRGPLNVEALGRAFDTLALRHEVLRTRVELRDGAPRAVIDSTKHFDLPLLDLSEPAGAEREAELERLIAAVSAQRFDLAQAWPWRALLVRCSADEHVLITAWHHIASDAWSAGIVARELGALYDGYAAGRPPVLAALPIQYADFASWQAPRLQGKLDDQIGYWKAQLAGSPPALDLPTDFRRPALQTYHGAEETLPLGLELSAALRRLSRNEGVTLFMTLLAAWKTLLWRYSDQNDMLVGTPIAGRNAVETEGLIGLFLNTLVLRTEIDGELSFRELLGRVRGVALGAFAHAELPFERLVEELRVERDPGRPPLFNVLFNLRNVQRPRLALANTLVTPIAAPSRIAAYELSLAVDEQPDGLLLQLEYNTDLWQQATVKRMLLQLSTLLTAASAEPGTPIARLPLQDGAGQELIEHAGRDRAPVGTQSSITQLWHERMLAAPDATALVWRGERTTYAELERRANRVARGLRAAGVLPGATVGVFGERSPESVAGFLGVLKVGGVYLPLDPRHPAERLLTMITDSGAEFVVGRRDDRLLRRELAARWLDVDELPESASDEPDFVAAADAALYLMYTSGSTGAPKGVLMEHGAVLHRLVWMWQAYPFAPGEVGCHKTAVDFADAIWEMLGPLLQGIPSLIVAEDDVRNPSRLVELLAQHNVTRLWLVPTLLRALLDSVSELAATLPALRMWVTTGEAISLELYDRFRREMPHAELHNLYDASEALGIAWYAPEQAPRPFARVPIGRALGSAQLLVLDRFQQPAPIGVPGEIYMGGPSLARGYNNQPELTAERFVAHPWGKPGERLYRTGDRARLLEDGTVEYLGRLDRQIKLRGFRIEPGEIEAALERHPCVLRAVIELQHKPDGEQRLVGYVVEREAVADRELREHLRSLLPSWMLPAVWVRLPELPLTSSGKLDRRALPAPEVVQAPMSSAEAPHDPLELQLKLLWGSLLDRRPLGVHDDFWELGGHSLLAVRMVAQIEERLGYRVPLSALFGAPTITGLAALLRKDWSPPWSSLTAMQPGGSKPPLFWVPPAGSTILSLIDLARNIGDEYPLYAFQPRGLDGEAEPDTRVDEMARHYVHEMRRLQPEGPYLLGGKCMGGRVALEMAQQLTAQGQQVALLVIHDTTPRGRPATMAVDHYRSRLSFWRERGDVAGALARKAQRIQTGLRRKISGTLGSAADRRIQRVRDAHAEASRTFVPQPYNGGRVTLLWSSEFWELRGATCNASWSRVAQSGFSSTVVPGDHDGLMREPLVRTFAAQLRVYIDEAIGGWTSPRPGAEAPG